MKSSKELRRRLQRHEEVLGHGHDLAEIEPAECSRGQLADVEVVLLVRVRRRLVVAVDDRRVAGHRGQPRDDVEVGYALGAAGIARVGLGVVVDHPSAGRQLRRHQLLDRRGPRQQVVRRRLGQLAGETHQPDVDRDEDRGQARTTARRPSRGRIHTRTAAPAQNASAMAVASRTVSARCRPQRDPREHLYERARRRQGPDGQRRHQPEGEQRHDPVVPRHGDRAPGAPRCGRSNRRRGRRPPWPR